MKKRLVLVFCILGWFLSVQAQPATSRGEQRLPISFQEGMARAEAALRAEGYVNIGVQANMALGYKGENTAMIMVNEATNGTYWINIVVASLTNNAGIPGGERVKLQGRIGNPSTNANPPGPTGTTAADWNTTAVGWRGKNNQQVSFTCPSSGKPSTELWGTDTYTDDSSICTAAVHAGVITYGGGNVTIEIRPGLSAYSGSARNGVTSKGYGGWHSSFIFIR
ncbi:hypothetical protein IC229_25090 [Spirosoma sp. BT702]|uniref:LCCL domain-containing protein n=1 Tax=Spirosoma profusum TaxID=2771354 RepID=A0A926Y124_9BACT|nr:LCCL domain-containing protein [Spirosoma profusum]MBD2703945.1 hypothetical protein [Spirosoma profusum]